MNVRTTQDDDCNTDVDATIQVFTETPARDFLVNCAAKAAHNAEKYMSAEDWQAKRAQSGNPARADILMAFDPQPATEIS